MFLILLEAIESVSQAAVKPKTPSPSGVGFGEGVRRHPAQIYESPLHLLMAFAIFLIIVHGWLRNQRLKIYLIAYCVYRFLTEFIRPEPEYALGLTYFQWVVLVRIVGLSAQWCIDSRSAHQSIEAVEIWATCMLI